MLCFVYLNYISFMFKKLIIFLSLVLVVFIVSACGVDNVDDQNSTTLILREKPKVMRFVGGNDNVNENLVVFDYPGQVTGDLLAPLPGEGGDFMDDILVRKDIDYDVKLIDRGFIVKAEEKVDEEIDTDAWYKVSFDDIPHGYIHDIGAYSAERAAYVTNPNSKSNTQNYLASNNIHNGTTNGYVTSNKSKSTEEMYTEQFDGKKWTNWDQGYLDTLSKSENHAVSQNYLNSPHDGGVSKNYTEQTGYLGHEDQSYLWSLNMEDFENAEFEDLRSEHATEQGYYNDASDDDVVYPGGYTDTHSGISSAPEGYIQNYGSVASMSNSGGYIGLMNPSWPATGYVENTGGSANYGGYIERGLPEWI